MHQGLYEDDLYSELIDYWIDCWRTIVDGVKNGDLGIRIINIRVLVQDLVNDYEQNEFQSKVNRILYIDLIERLLKDSKLTIFRAELNLLKESLVQQDYQSVYVISKNLVSKLGKTNFAIDEISSIIDILKTKKNALENRRAIDSITEKIIIELITQGYRVDDLKYLLSECFDGYRIKDNEIVIIAYSLLPEEITNLSDKNEFSEKAKIFIDNLTILNRLEILKSKLLGKLIDRWFIFPIWGMAYYWKEESYLLGGYLYSPELSPISETDRTIDEFFYVYPSTQKVDSEEIKNSSDVEDTHNKSVVNLKVLVSSISYYSGYEHAKSILRDVINFLNIEFGSEYNEIFCDEQYRSVSKDKTGFSGTLYPIGEDKEFSRKRNISRTNPVHVYDRDLSEIGKKLSLLNDSSRYSDIEKNTIRNVAQLFNDTRGKTDRDKILNYWIILESLSSILRVDKSTTFDFLKKIITNRYILAERYRPLHVIFSKMDHYARLKGFYSNKLKGISQELLNQIGVNSSIERRESISLLPLYRNLSELSYCVEDEDLKQLVEETIKFYSDNDYALKSINEKEENVKLTVSYIYKTRNQLVHNGFVNQSIVPHLVRYAEGYALSLFHRILNVSNGDKFVDLKLHFVEEDFEVRCLKNALRNDKTFRILDEMSFTSS